ncbi:ectoine/hydroxyectoine ABC transporter, ATP-binding protein [Nitrosococcus halophilus Nc 4]|uniref:Ectoine/hydroxyectoine ABC transporter, ATP-binding protein n=1 Tax=Nitrosococcus halophilus (strain Nc4) TaxID=472759 RepID=D5BX94_NITHN|nr:ectoine/hydroxyectoine ABC transporter ATP-binding protein EhuA [Nitrosococcus halophilus]ADE15777.1 ectoine/hydroxyectoine ABC transporter, ATP-binding protein [Nitrosococcus halophilus Nc 4]
MREVWKSFDGLTVLKGIDLDIPPSQKIALIGPSGSGKSTILRILMTLEGIDSGRVEIDGESIWTMQRDSREVPADRHHIRKIRGKVGMVFQHFNLFPHMSVLRNVTEAMVHVLHLPQEEAEKGAVDLLKLVGLEDKIENYPAQLSGGQKQRVAIARALALRPQIMLFDEVTSALDPELVGEVLSVLRQIAIESEMTMLIVTHEMSFAQEIADRVIFMAEGKIIEDNTPEIIFSRPTQKRTQEFLRTIL